MNNKNKTRPIIAITGSAGKTTTKQMIAAILSRRLRIFKSPKNLNLAIHTAQYAKQIWPAHQAIVLEYALLLPGEIQRHCKMIKPNISVITNVGSAHVGNFNGSVEELAKGKSEIIQGMDPFGKLYLNADDTNSKFLLTDSFQGSITTIGMQTTADYQASQVRYETTGMSFQVELDGKNYRFMIPVFGVHNIYNALFAIAVTHQLGFTPEDMQHGFDDSFTYLKNTSRLSVYPLANQIQLIDDSWSANPQAVKAALDVLENLGKMENIAVLADMLELGSYTMEGHLEVGRYIAEKKVDFLFTFGSFAKYMAEGAIQSGFPKEKIIHFDKIALLNDTLLKYLKAGSTVLIKGSHSMGMNRTVQYLLYKLRKM